MRILMKTTANWLIEQANKGIPEFIEKIKELQPLIIAEKETFFLLKEEE